MPAADALIQEIDGLLDAPRAEGIAAALSVWTPQGGGTRWTTPEPAAQANGPALAGFAQLLQRQRTAQAQAAPGAPDAH